MSPGSGTGGAQASIDEGAVDALDPSVARALGVAPLRLDDGGLLVAGLAEEEQPILRTLRLMLDVPVRLVAADAGEIERVQLLAYGEPEEQESVVVERPAPLPVSAAAGAAERERYREIAAGFGLPFVSLEPHRGPDGELIDPVDPETARLLSAEACRALGVLPITSTGGSFALATARPAACLLYTSPSPRDS